MKRPSIPLLLGCLLVGTAGVLVVTPNGAPHEAASNPPTRTRDRHPRPAIGVSPARLLASTRQHTAASREAWARSLDDAELKRLTLALIAAYQDKGNSQNDIASWLVPLAKEWGRRDIDGLLMEMAALIPGPIVDDRDAVLSFSNVRSAALIGLSEIDPQKAWQFLIPPKESSSIHIRVKIPTIVETIFRNWAKQDPAQAWHELSNSSVTGWNSSDAIRGLIAGSSDPDLHKEILQWIADRKRQAKEAGSFPGDAVVSRNNIDAILNNPNRYTYESFVTSAALGLAEHDPEKAWAWLNSQPRPRFDHIPANGNTTTNSLDFLRDWAQRQPQEVIAFMNRHPDQITSEQIVGTASSLLSNNPELSLEVFAGIPDLASSEDIITFWIASAVRTPAITEWPLVEPIPTPLPVSESARRIMENLDRLALPESTTAALRLKLEKLTTSKADAAPP